MMADVGKAPAKTIARSLIANQQDIGGIERYLGNNSSSSMILMSAPQNTYTFDAATLTTSGSSGGLG